MSDPILLVEDDPISQDVIRALCEARGLTVDVATDGFLGLKRLREGRHPIALIDYHLPEMDGYALARLMREVSGGREAPLRLVGITADRDGLAARRGADALFDAILVKPLDPARLFATLDRLMAPPDPAGAARACDALACEALAGEALARAEAFLQAPDAGRAAMAAEAFWRRRGLDRLPRAVACPAPTAEQTAALSVCFALTGQARDADLVLMLDPTGLDGLRALRAEAETALIPAIDLGGGLAEACEATFRVEEAGCWSATADLLRAVAERRGPLAAEARRPHDPDTRLLALLHVLDRPLVLRRGADGTVAGSIETGLPSTALLARVAELRARGLLACEAGAGVITATPTPLALHRLSGQDRPADAAPAAPRAEETVLRSRVAALLEPTVPPEEPAAEITAAPSTAAPSAVLHTLGIEEEAPLLNRRKTAELGELIGAENVAALRGRLVERLAGAFRPAATEALAREAHDLISIAGMLGCDRLSGACTRLERAAKTGEALDAALATARSVRDETLALLAPAAETAAG